MKNYRAEGLDKELFMLAGIPVVISKPAMKMISSIPGVSCPEAFLQRLEKAENLKEEGVKVARDMVETVKAIDGVHLMLLGSDHSVLPNVVSGF
jgi:5,10-methylenetetrahydrofolate reductase